MKIGMPSMTSVSTLEDCVALCKGLCLDFIEFNANQPQFLARAIDPEIFGRTLRQEGLFCTFHLDENLDPCHFDSKIASAYQRSVLDSIALAQQLETPVLNMHMPMGTWFTLPEERVYLYQQYEDQYLSRLKRFRNRCQKAIGDSGLRICVENTTGWPPHSRKGLELLLESPVFELTMDVGHNMRTKGRDEGFFVRHLDRLRHMHLHDVAGDRDHQPLGAGEMDLAAPLDLAEERDCTCVLEVRDPQALTESAYWVANYFGRIKPQRLEEEAARARG